MEIQAQTINRAEEVGRNGLIERTEFECHDCGQMIYSDVDLSVNGNHVINCPCGHEHCRVVKNGRITSARWDQRNGNTPVSTATGIVFIPTQGTSTSTVYVTTTASTTSTLSTSFGGWSS